MISLIFLNSIASVEDIQAAGDAAPLNLVAQVVIGKFIQAQSSCYMNIMCTIMIGLMFVLLGMPVQRPIFYKEQSSKQYSILAYFSAKVFIQVVSISCGTLIYTSIVYWMLGFDKDLFKFIYFSITVVQISLIGNSIGFFVGSLFKDTKKAASLTPTFILPMSMLSGLWNKLNYIPSWIGWLQYLSPFRYALQMLMQNQYQDFVYNNRGIQYNYRKDLDVTMDWLDSFLIVLALSFFFYFSSYLLMVFNSGKISP